MKIEITRTITTYYAEEPERGSWLSLITALLGIVWAFV
tara:strand:- start:318 stop:431 length:114 start_codon:yes stop_codon:yes gene_type:complete